MDLHLTSMPALLRKPSGYIPLVMSGLALALLLGSIIAVYAQGQVPQREEDEGVAAHLYQLLIGCQIFPMGWFALRWGSQAPFAAFGVLVLQVMAILVTFGPLWYYGL